MLMDVCPPGKPSQKGNLVFQLSIFSLREMLVVSGRAFYVLSVSKLPFSWHPSCSSSRSVVEQIHHGVLWLPSFPLDTFKPHQGARIRAGVTWGPYKWPKINGFPWGYTP